MGSGYKTRAAKGIQWLIPGCAAMLLCLVQTACNQTPEGSKSASGEYSVRDFGAANDGKTMASPAIQKAIDLCGDNGGGTVRIPPGTYLCGTLNLRSGVNLRLERGAAILGSPNPSDYRTPGGALISAVGQDNVSITGAGVIDGNGGSPDFKMKDNDPTRPYILRFNACRNVLVEGVTLKNSAAWVQHYKECDGVHIDRVTVYSHSNLNNDGLDIDSANVTVSNCIIDSDDDAICLKSDNRLKPCENVTITNCVAASNCNAIKMGTASLGGFKNIAISNCVVRACKEQSRRKWRNAISGLALEIVDGGTMDGISVSNISMTDIQTPIFVRLGDRGVHAQQDPVPPVGAIRNVMIRGIVAKGDSLVASSVTGIPGGRISGIKLSDITLDCPGGGDDTHLNQKVPEAVKKYPDAWMFGKSLPSYGLYVRHVDNIALDNIRFTLRGKDRRPAILCEDVERLRISGVEADEPEGGSPCLKLVDAREAHVFNSFLFAKAK